MSEEPNVYLKLKRSSWENFFRVMNNRKKSIELVDGSSLGNFNYDIYNEPMWKIKSLEYCDIMNWICEKCGKYGDECHHKRNGGNTMSEEKKKPNKCNGCNYDDWCTKFKKSIPSRERCNYKDE